MIIDDIADIFDKACQEKGVRGTSRHTGLSTNAIYGIKAGCGFNLNAKFIAALASLGYELHVVKRRK